MPRGGLSGSFSTPRVDVLIDMGNPLLNITVDGFLKIGAVAATRVAAEDAYHAFKRGSLSGDKIEHSLKKMCKEGAYWGTVAGVYAGMEYGVERIRGTRDWIVMDAITGSAIATAAEFINYLT
ncbi:hypothetical protein CRG98_043217 [Punica granatum]|uniref:Outer envelope pore protein 16, chloroplastic n=1 Tax=Punica granatum TaxID=22663 RepID=A0A2I0HXK6_PUNGR|nr:hypothetical protein CRG98_043217 [Punica granatum]